MNINLLNSYNKYWPSLFATTTFGVTYYFTPKNKIQEQIPVVIPSVCTEGDEWNFACTQIEYRQVPHKTDYWSYLTHTPLTLAGAFLGFTVSSNLLFGRRPSSNWKHNPPFTEVMETMGTIVPRGFAILTGIGATAATMAFGERAKSVVHLVSIGTSAVVTLFSGAVLDTIKNDHAIDRCLLYTLEQVKSLNIKGARKVKGDRGVFYSLGEMRFIEKLAMKTENAILNIVFLISNSIFTMSEFGITKIITINDANRGTLKALQIAGARTINHALVAVVNEYAFYSEKWADIPVISLFLNYIGIANKEVKVKVIEIKGPLVQRVAGEIGEAVETLTDGVMDLGHIIAEEATEIQHIMATKIQNLWLTIHPRPNIEDVVIGDGVKDTLTGARKFGHVIAEGFRGIGHDIAEIFRHHDEQADTSSATSTGSNFFGNLFGGGSCSNVDPNEVYDPSIEGSLVGEIPTTVEETE